MKRLLPIFLLLAASVHGQMVQQIVNGGGNPITLQPGWTYLQGPFSGGNQNGGIAPCTTGTSCTVGFAPTTTGSVWTAILLTSTAGVKISTVCTAATSAGCSGSTAEWNLCPTSNCAKSQSGITVDMAYAIGGASGSKFMTVTFSGSATNPLILFVEGLAPAGFTGAFDVAPVAVSSASCTTCTAVGFSAGTSLAGTDFVVQAIVGTGFTYGGSGQWNSISSPYFEDFNGNVIGLNITSGTAPTITQSSGAFVAAAIAFKTTVNFTPNSDNTFYTVKQLTDPNFSGVTCSPACPALTVTSLTAGDLVYLTAASLNGGNISSVSGGGTWATPPAGCKVALTGNANDVLSCTYTLAAIGGSTTITPTMSTTAAYTFGIFEVHASSGSWNSDSHSSANRAACVNCSGISPTISGLHGDVVFQNIFCAGGCNALTLYPYSFNSGGNGPNFGANAGSALLINTRNTTAPIWGVTNEAVAVTGSSFYAQ